MTSVIVTSRCQSKTVSQSLELCQVKNKNYSFSPEHRTNLVSLLEQLRSQVSLETPPSSNLLNICRTDVLDGALRAFQRTRFSPYGRLSVVFMDEMSQAEGAVDEGGPTREFFRLLMMKIRDSMLFSGPEEEKYLNLDSDGT